jgi:hypothetical protein
VTAIDGQVRAAAEKLANLLQLPIVGTLRTIAYTDFDKNGFQDTQKIGSESQKIVSKVAPNALANGESPTMDVQKAWLDSFSQETVNAGDLAATARVTLHAPWQ